MTEHLDVVIVGAGISGISAAWHLQDRCPYQELCDSRAPRQSRRHLGPVQVPGHPLGLRHVHPRVPVQAVDGGEGHRRRAVDHGLPQGDGRRVRHRQAHPLQPAGSSAPTGPTPTTAGPFRSSATVRKRRSPHRSCSPPAATTTTTRVTPRNSQAPMTSRERSSIRSTGPRTWITPASDRRHRQWCHRSDSDSGSCQIRVPAT